MYGRQHFGLTLVTILFFLPSIVLPPLVMDFPLIERILLIIFIPFFILMGSLLPDSDSENRGSKIFYTIFAVLALIVNYFENHIAKALGMRKGHRQSLHTFKGILLSSLIIILIFALLLTILYKFQLTIIIVCYIFLVIGQLLHLLQDKVENPWIYLGIIILVFLIWYGGLFKLGMMMSSNSNSQKISIENNLFCTTICENQEGLREEHVNEKYEFISCVCNNLNSAVIDINSGTHLSEFDLEE
jgi:hypothetical protein